jgi:hypothetical protein
MLHLLQTRDPMKNVSAPATRPIALKVEKHDRQLALMGFLASIMLGAIFILGSCKGNSSSAPAHTSLNQTTATVRPKGCPELDVIKASMTRGGFGTTATWKVRFKNTSTNAVGNLHYKTTYFAETGKVVGIGGESNTDRDSTLYRRIEPNNTRELEIDDGFINAQAVTADFKLTDCEIIVEPKPELPAALEPSQSQRDRVAKKLSARDRGIWFRAEGKTLVETTNNGLSSDENAAVTKETWVDDAELRHSLRSFGFIRLKLETDDGQTFSWELR